MNRNPARQILEGVREMAPSIAARAVEIERARRLPADLLRELRALGLFRMLVPEKYGGYALEFPATIEILSELAAADGSTGWTTMIGSHAPLVFGNLTLKSFEKIYASGPDIIAGGSTAPQGRADPIESGFRVTGRWSMASGCEHADWMFGVCADVEPAVSAIAGSPPAPRLRYITLPAAQWKIVDTWNSTGLRGTGSHDLQLLDTKVDSAWTVSFAAMLRAPLRSASQFGQHLQKVMHVAAVAIGIAEGALRDLTELGASGKRRVYARQALSDVPIFQHRLGHAEADVRAASALLRECVGVFWSQAQRGRLERSVDILIFQSTAWIAETCTRAVDSCFRAAGASAVYETSPLQRRLRDIHTLSQHTLLQEGYFAGAGAIRLNRPALVPLVREATLS
jgi:indole-3-acetate monooxygenase